MRSCCAFTSVRLPAHDPAESESTYVVSRSRSCSRCVLPWFGFGCSASAFRPRFRRSSVVATLRSCRRCAWLCASWSVGTCGRSCAPPSFPFRAASLRLFSFAVFVSSSLTVMCTLSSCLFTGRARFAHLCCATVSRLE